MRILKLFPVLFFTAFIIFSCANEEISKAYQNTELANQQNKLEDAPVPLANLNSGILIDGAIIKNTTPPKPNSTINLAVEPGTIEGLLKSGFDLHFTSTESNIAGVYLQFKDVDGNTTSSYFDIPLEHFKDNKKANPKKNLTSKNTFSTQKNNSPEKEYVIDVNFADSFPPGKFCGLICIYDDKGNISEPVTVCVEVEAWGGNAEITGEWDIEDSTFGEQSTLLCANNKEIEVNYEQKVSEKVNLTFLENGNFEIINKGEWKTLDDTASANSCSPIYKIDSYLVDAKTTGKWAYNEVAKKLTLVAFSYVDVLNSQENEDYPYGDLIFEGASIEIINGKLIITDTNNDTYTFKRK